MQKSLRHPFRLFFPLTALAILIALLPWLTLALAPKISAYFALDWHAFAFISLSACSAFAGFLLTALPSWCEDKRNLSIHSIVLTILWFGILFSLPFLKLSAWICSAFWLYLFLLASHIVYCAKAQKQLALLLIVFSLLCCSIFYAHTTNRLWLFISLDLMMVAVFMVSFRVGFVLGNQALKDQKLDNLQFIPNPYYKNIACILLFLAAFAPLYSSAQVQGWLYLASAFAFTARLDEWHHKYFWRINYVRIFYLIQWALILAYALLALALLFAPMYLSIMRHFLFIAVYLNALLLIMNIAGQRHSGLNLSFSLDLRLGFYLLIVAGITRGAWLFNQGNPILYFSFSAFAIACVFIYYAWRYILIFKRTEPH